MPRNSAGVFTLVNGNPVVPNTLIETNWANPTLADIAQAMTDSLDRYGRGVMQAPMKFADGTVATPSISFGSESSTGFYHPNAGTLGISVLGSATGLWSANGLQIKGLTIADGSTQMFKVDGTEVLFSVPPRWAGVPTNDADLVNKAAFTSFFTSQAGGGFLPLAGGTLSGNLTLKLPINPQLWLEATTNPANLRKGAVSVSTDGTINFVAVNDAGSVTGGLFIQPSGYVFDQKTQGRIWTSGNMGAGSTLNADLVDGYHADVGVTASTVLVRDINKNIGANALYGGANGAGVLINHGGGSSTCFRWDGTNLFYRVNEAVDRQISTISTSNFPFDKANIGYMEMPNGFVLQWGEGDVAIDNSNIFNLKRPWSVGLAGWACINFNGNITGSSVIGTNVLWISATQIAVGISDQSWSGTAHIKWFAIGY